MRFVETSLAGAYTIEPVPHTDTRGFFARIFCSDEFAARGLASQVAQANLSHNHERGTVRGMHYQLPPSSEAKLVRCVRGAIYDVIVDLRAESPTYRRWFGAQLTEHNATAMYVPEMFAHGFQTLEDDTRVLYQSSEMYDATRERGLRHDDPRLGIEWPLATTTISEKDSAWPMLEPTRGDR
jgi:dTDP-4-dehydrorhamnose 3,5-epimerase